MPIYIKALLSLWSCQLHSFSCFLTNILIKLHCIQVRIHILSHSKLYYFCDKLPASFIFLIFDEYIYLRKTTENCAGYTFIHNAAGQTLFCRSFKWPIHGFLQYSWRFYTIVKSANLLLVLETQTILNYRMQNGIIEYIETN